MHFGNSTDSTDNTITSGGMSALTWSSVGGVSADYHCTNFACNSLDSSATCTYDGMGYTDSDNLPGGFENNISSNVVWNLGTHTSAATMSCYVQFTDNENDTVGSIDSGSACQDMLTVNPVATPGVTEIL